MRDDLCFSVRMSRPLLETDFVLTMFDCRLSSLSMGFATAFPLPSEGALF